jgi:hypothetical protein
MKQSSAVANQKSDDSTPHPVMLTSNTAQSKGVNPNSLARSSYGPSLQVLV